MDDCSLDLICLLNYVAERVVIKADDLTIGGHPDGALRDDGVLAVPKGHMKTIDDLFPIMHRREPPRPFPGLTIVGGLASWGFDVRYHRNPFGLTLSAVMFVPARDTGLPIRVANEHTFQVAALGDDPEYAVSRLMHWVRGFAMHEVLEGLVFGGQPFFQREVEADHVAA